MTLHLLPRTLPPLSQLLLELGASPAQIGRALDVSERTVFRWVAADCAPRAAALALFWVTSWGWSAVVSEAGHRLSTAEGLTDALRLENAGLVARIARLERLGDFGAANAPTATACPAARAPLAIAR